MEAGLESPPVISRIEQILFLLMLVACVAMAAILILVRQHAHDRLQKPLASQVSLSQAPDEPLVSVTLMMPDDKTGSLDAISRTLALPRDQSSRAHALIEHLIASWRAPGSPHPVKAAAGVEGVFLMPVPGHPKQQLAVVNLNAAFPHAQPSGIEPETLTLLSIIQTLHADIPSITEVRFLVNGRPRATLAGHADLTRTYLAETVVSGPES